jgi:BASS family bile acid:Na+ symporter
MSDDIFIVIATFGVVFVITAAMLQGLIITVDLLRAGFKGRRQSQAMVLLARFVVVPLVIIGLASIVHFGASGYGPQIDMAVCVLVLTAGPPFIPAIAKLAHGDIPYAASSALMLTVLTWILLPFTLPVALNFLGTGASVSSSTVAQPLVAFYVIPLVAGFLIRARYPNLAKDIIPHLKTIAIATLLLSVALYIAVSWSELTSLFLTGMLGFAVAIPLISLFIGFVLSPPLARRTTAETPDRSSKITSIISISLQNIGACLVCAFFVLPSYPLAGVAILIFALGSIFVTVLVMAELGRRHERALAAATPAQTNPAAAGGKSSS